MISESEMAGISSARQRLVRAAGRLRNLECVLCEDDRSLMFYAQDGRGEWAATCCELDHPVREGWFDASPYILAMLRSHLGSWKTLMRALSSE